MIGPLRRAEGRGTQRKGRQGAAREGDQQKFPRLSFPERQANLPRRRAVRGVSRKKIRGDKALGRPQGGQA